MDTFDNKMIQKSYAVFPAKVEKARQTIGRPLTLTEKIMYAHLSDGEQWRPFNRAVDYVNFSPDRVAMQDATAQMALLQFMTSGRPRVAVPTSVHCDHLIQAYQSASADLHTAETTNKEVYDFLQSASNKYGIGFWKPGSGIIHQIVLENYAFPGGMMIGTDSHTPNAGGLGMIAIGVGGADAVDVMSGMPWELKMPRIFGIRLRGCLSGWASPKDIILKLAGLLTVKGGTNAVLEYFGEGTESLSATGKATICNMGAEVGATTSIFPFDGHTAEYLRITGRDDVAVAAEAIAPCLRADDAVAAHPGNYYDRVIDIDLSELEPQVNGPFTPDDAHRVSAMAEVVAQKGYPRRVEAALIGSCTNSSYEDLSRVAHILAEARKQGLSVKAQFIVNPGSQRVYATALRDGIIEEFVRAGAKIMANACGPCIGQWKRTEAFTDRPNSIVTSFNRNFAKRNDGNPNTHAFVTSPEMVVAYVLSGDLCFNPLKETLTNDAGQPVRLAEPRGEALPVHGFESGRMGFVPPASDGQDTEIVIADNSSRLQRLVPFPCWDGRDSLGNSLLIKVKGKCTTDHISMAGPWLKYRGHLDNISDNMLIGAINYFNGKTNSVKKPESGAYEAVPALARHFKAEGKGSVVVAEENYGEGSSREHAAMEPRFLNVKAVLAKSFARIHETNLKKQGMLALTFADKNDYDKIREDDCLSILGLTTFQPGKNLTVRLEHADGTTESFDVVHTYNQLQIEWFKVGSALNYMRSRIHNS